MRPSQVNGRLLALCVSLAILGLAAGVTAWRVISASRAPSTDSLIVLPKPRAIAQFDLLDQNGQPFTLDGLKGHWSLLFFGFTSCPDVCPNTLYQLQQARELSQNEHADGVFPQVYLVTVDPERDTPQKLAAYLAYFDSTFIGLTGTTMQLQALASQLGIAFFVEAHAAGTIQYGVDHSASLLLLDPLARLYAVLPAPHEASKLAAEILTVSR